jgi:hypothetical protein
VIGRVRVRARQMPHDATRTGHGVGVSCKIVEGRDVSVITLVEGLQSKKSGRRAT